MPGFKVPSAPRITCATFVSVVGRVAGPRVSARVPVRALRSHDRTLRHRAEKAAALAAVLGQIDAEALEPADTIDVSTPDAVVLR